MTAEGRCIVWKLPLYNTVHNILTNPVYAGAYAFGRTTSKVIVEEGRKRVRRGLRRPSAEWDVLLKDQHEGYITWDEFESNQRVIANNATGKGSAAARGAVRHGELLLAGLLRCGHCGRKMYVAYGGKAGRYHCQGALVNHGTKRCISFGGLRADHAVGAEVLRVLKPLGVDAAVKAIEAQASETSAAQKQLELALQRARYEAAHARRQYDAVDPANRLVAGELERRWNEALEAMQHIESEIAAIEAAKPSPLGEKEREQLMRLGADLKLAWSHPAATSATRKRIVRAALNEIIVRIEGGFIEMVLHWQGGDHTALKVKMNTCRQAPLDSRRGYLDSGPGAGAADARSADRTASSIAPASRRAGAMAGPRRGCARSATTTTLPSIAKANGPSGARSLLKLLRKSWM